MEEMSPIHHANLASRDFVTSTETDDHSNPQQGTGATKGTAQVNQDTVQVKNRCHPFAAKHSEPPSNHAKDTRKLFVGGLPTDITVPEFRDFFSQFGELEEALVMFDRETQRSRGFGFVTYVNPDVSKSLLQMGDQGDGIGRLVMRGKICEVKAAAPKVRAPTRRGKGNRGYRGALRNHYQAQTYQMPSFAHTKQFPDVCQSDGYNLPFYRGVYESASSENHNLMYYHPTMALHEYGQPYTQPSLHGSILLTGDRDPRGAETVGVSYLLSPPLETNLAEHYSVPNTFSLSPQIPAYFYQQCYGYIPLVRNPVHPAHQVTEIDAKTKPMEPGI